jgi:hypothetical protein
MTLFESSHFSCPSDSEKDHKKYIINKNGGDLSLSMCTYTIKDRDNDPVYTLVYTCLTSSMIISIDKILS